MRPELIAIFSIFVIFAVAESLQTGFIHKTGQRRKDIVVEVVSTLSLLVFTQPVVLLAGGLLTAALFPESRDRLADIPLLAQIGLLLIFDDMTQYWWHRAVHTTPWLYNLHRAHHDAEYMSIRVVYRNNIFYYLLMPGLWFSGAFIYLGLGKVYAAYIVFKMLVIAGAHSDVHWDEGLYKNKWASPVMWIVERVISTPATHAAHHGRHRDDGVTNYKGNYGNLLFLWDVLFGTAKIRRRYPKKIGVENLQPASAKQQLLWPLARDAKAAD